MSFITAEMIQTISPRVKESYLDELVESFNEFFPQYEINNHRRVTHFLAQAAHESDGFQTMEEYATGRAYEGRRDLGNVKLGDGTRFKGRGIFQLTGRANYQRYGEDLGLDLINNPRLASIPRNSVMIACEYWNLNKLNVKADLNDIVSITRRINGGINGLNGRKKYHAICIRVIPQDIFVENAGPYLGEDINIEVEIQLGDQGEEVAELQQLLYDIGYDIVADGIFGPRTEVIVKDFQKKNRILANGIVDGRTLNLLKA